jgi:hypothetical protein
MADPLPEPKPAPSPADLMSSLKLHVDLANSEKTGDLGASNNYAYR